MDIIDKIKQTGISVDNLSKATGIPTSRIYKWFSKKAEPKYADTKLLEDFLNKGIIKPDVATPEKVMSVTKNEESLHKLIDSNADLVITNKKLTDLLERAMTNSNSGHPADFSQACLERIAEQGIGVRLFWKTKAEGLSILGNFLSETVKGKHEAST